MTDDIDDQKIYFDFLPKDLIEHLKNYSGPLDAYYLKWRNGGNWHGGEYIKHFERKYYVNKSRAQMNSIKRSGNILQRIGEIKICRIIFIDGKANRVYPIPKLYGLPRKRNRTIPVKSYRCNGKTVKGVRCKMKITHSSQYCSKHRPL